MGFSDKIDGFAQVASGELAVAASDAAARPYAVRNPGRLSVSVADGARCGLVLSHAPGVDSDIDVCVGEDSVLNVVELFDGGRGRLRIVQKRGSRVALTSVALGSASAEYRTSLAGAGSEFDMGGVFLAGDGERASVKIRVEHAVADCRSTSVVKGVASGTGEGRFEGMVYVAQDAQRTDARQTSRNMTLGDGARITTLPQLEIYADDVKCSHGATVGQMNDDAVMYMRQRGLSEELARRLQIEGFVADVVMRCPVEEVCGALLEELNAKLEML